MQLDDAERAKLNQADISAYLPDIETLRTHAILANLSEGTRNDYVGYAKRIFSYLVVYRNAIPFKEASYEDFRQFVLYLVEQKAAPKTVNCYISTLVKLFYCVRHESFNKNEIPYQKVDRFLPKAISAADFLILYRACLFPVEKALLCLLFSSGMRIREALSAKFSDIRRADLRIYVAPGKGREDRYTLVSKSALDALGVYYRDLYQGMQKPTADTAIFMKKNRNGEIVPMTYEDARTILKRIIERAGLQERGYTLHSFRHGFALEIYRNTKDLMLISTLLGHKHLDATAIYVRLASVYKIREENIENPLDIALK